MNRIIKVLVVFFLFFFCFTDNVFAFSFSISSISPTVVISKEQEVVINLLIDDLPAGDSYFRAGWYSSGSYVGYVMNNSGDWIKLDSLDSDNCKNYFKINSSTSSAALKIKIGSDFDIANGDVDIRAHRITSTCGSNIGSNLFPSQINLPTPIPTVPPTQKPSTLPPTSEPTSKPTTKPTNVPTGLPNKTNRPEVLAENTIKVDSTPIPTVLLENLSTKPKSNFPTFAIIIIAVGFMFILLAGYLAFRIRYNNNREAKN